MNLRDLRTALKKDGKTIIDDEISEELRELYTEMNAAKINAMREAEKPFLERIKAIEKRHGIVLIMKAE